MKISSAERASSADGHAAELMTTTEEPMMSTSAVTIFVPPQQVQ